MSKGKVIFCTPSVSGPVAPYIKSLEESIPLIVEAGWEEGYTQEVGNPYISAARANMTRKALDAKADIIIYLDSDESWDPQDLLTLIETPGDVVAGTYRMKFAEEQYMGTLMSNAQGTPLLRKDGCIRAMTVPGGFLKVTKEAIDKFMTHYPDLCYGPKYNQSIDLFNHGAHKGLWWGEDYAFSRNWCDAGGEIWMVPNLNIDHHCRKTGEIYKGNLHEFLMRQPGGSKSDNPIPPISMQKQAVMA